MNAKRPAAASRKACLGRRMPITPPFMVLRERRSPPTVKSSSAGRKDSVKERLRGLGFSDADAAVLADHFLDAEARGKTGHGLSRVAWLAALPDLDPGA